MPVCKYCNESIEWLWDDGWRPVHQDEDGNPTLICPGIPVRKGRMRHIHPTKYRAAKKLARELESGFETALGKD